MTDGYESCLTVCVGMCKEVYFLKVSGSILQHGLNLVTNLKVTHA